jgi:hypothetical protein
MSSRRLAAIVTGLVLAGTAAASPAGAADADYTLGRDGSIGGVEQGAVSALVERFGAPSTRRAGEGASCTLAWSGIGLRAESSVFGDTEADPCDDGIFTGARAAGSRWHTGSGLRKGASSARIRREAVARCGSGTRACYVAGRRTPVRNGWILSTHRIGCAPGRYPTLIAITTGGRLSSFAVNWVGCE